MSVAVSSSYVSTLGDINGDGTLTPAEIAAGKFCNCIGCGSVRL